MKPGDQPRILEYDHPYGDKVMLVRQTTEIIEVFERCNVRHPIATSWADRNSWKGHQPCARRAGHDGQHQTAQGITWPEEET